MSHLGHNSLIDAAIDVLKTADPADKCTAAARADALRTNGAPSTNFYPQPLEKPARPTKPILIPPGDVVRRKLGSPEGRIALLHAVAHIEFNAIDLAFDMAARFSASIDTEGLDAAEFVADGTRIGGEEARHFGLIEARLADLGAAYGDLPAHNGLWEAAEATRENVLARLAIAPLILEARGLDVTPAMIDRLRDAGDDASAGVLAIIYQEEIGHVACGKRWFDAVCAARDLDPNNTCGILRQEYYPGRLKPPFNHVAREQAGLTRALYEPIGNENSA